MAQDPVGKPLSEMHLSEGNLVAVFGYFDQGNFGDDLMAVIFVRYLLEQGFQTRVYGLDPSEAEAIGTEVAETIPELLSGATSVVYAGGGLLLATATRTDARRRFESQIDALCDGCEELDLPIGLFSVGGDTALRETVSLPRLRLLDSASYVSLRNPEDVSLLDPGQPHDVFADIVWLAPRFFNVSRPGDDDFKGLRVGFDYGYFSSMRTRWRIWAVVRLVRVIRPSIKVTFVESRSQRTRIVPSYAAGCEVIQYKDVNNHVDSLSKLDVFITNRLHMGMVCLGFGATVFQVLPTPKASTLFARLGLGSNVLERPWPFLRLLWRLLRTDENQVLERQALVDVQELGQSADGHLCAVLGDWQNR